MGRGEQDVLYNVEGVYCTVVWGGDDNDTHGKGDFLVVVRNFVGIGHREERGGKWQPLFARPSCK